MKNAFVSFFLIASFWAQCADFTTKSGKTYQNYRVVKVSWQGILISHSFGMKTVPFDDLPDDIAGKYKDQHAKEIQKQNRLIEQNKLKKQRENAIAELKKHQYNLSGVSYRIVEIKPNYLIMYTQYDVMGFSPSGRVIPIYSRENDYPIMVVDIPTQKLHANSRIPGNTIINKEPSTVIWEIGTAQYNSTRIKKYTYSLDRAISYYLGQSPQQDTKKNLIPYSPR